MAKIRTTAAAIYGLIFLLALSAQAQNPNVVPSSPIFIAGPQGRPIPNATVTITIPSTGEPATAWADAAGTQPFPGVLSADQILQFYAESGTYNINVSGAGLSKVFSLTTTVGTNMAEKTISISRSPDMFNLFVDNTPPSLFCQPNGSCQLNFPTDVPSSATIDFLMPSFPLHSLAFLISWTAYDGPGSVGVWTLNWCSYPEGSLTCDSVHSPHAVSLPSQLIDAGKRTDLYFSVLDFPGSADAWHPSDHVVLSLTNGVGDSRYSLTSLQILEGFRMELSR